MVCIAAHVPTRSFRGTLTRAHAARRGLGARVRPRADFQMSADREIATGDTLKTFEASDVTRRDTHYRSAGAGDAAAGAAGGKADGGGAEAAGSGKGAKRSEDRAQVMEHETFVVFDNAKSIGRFSSLLKSDSNYPAALLECARARVGVGARVDEGGLG